MHIFPTLFRQGREREAVQTVFRVVPVDKAAAQKMAPGCNQVLFGENGPINFRQTVCRKGKFAGMQPYYTCIMGKNVILYLVNIIDWYRR